MSFDLDAKRREETVSERMDKEPHRGKDRTGFSWGYRRRKKGQIKNCFRITGKVKDTGCFLVKHMKNGVTNVRDHRRGTKTD